MKNSKTLLCLGFGYTAATLSRKLQQEHWKICGTTRDQSRISTLKKKNVTPILWDEQGIDEKSITNIDALLISTPPSDNGCPSLKVIRPYLEKHSLQWIGYLSSNGIYGDHNGAWVSEKSNTDPQTQRGKNRAIAEAEWVNFGRKHALPVIIFRLPGIYGPDRSVIDTIKAGKAKRIFKKGQSFSRAHVEDIAEVLKASIHNPHAGSIFNIADDEPAPPQDVVEYGCTLLGIDPPPLIALADANLSEMGRSFYSENKKISNELIKKKLGITLKFPTYRDGLEAIVKAQSS